MAVGAVTSMQQTQVDTGIEASTVNLNTGARLAGTGEDRLDSGPIKDGYEELTSIEVDPSSTS